MSTFAQRVAIVTGAASGIGYATAQAFIEAGASVALVDVNGDAVREAAASLGVEALGLAADVSSRVDVIGVMDAVSARFGRIDVLCNNAGFGLRGSVLEIEEEDWDRLMSVNVKGVYLCSKYALPHLTAHPTSAIVNTTSYTATTAIADRAAYVASKGAVSALTRAMAIDHAAQGVRVNAVAPGTVDSPYFARMIEASDDPAALRRSLDERSVLGRMATAQEIAKAILWLASDDSSFTTGTVFTVDGGSSIWGRN